MDLYTRTPKEKLSSYGQSPITQNTNNQTEPADYLKEFMNFMVGLPGGQGPEVEPDSTMVPTEKEVMDKPFEEDYVKTKVPRGKKAFVKQFGDAVGKEASKLGLSKDMVLAQMALETGWGKHAPKFNMGGIKADSRWKGKTQSLKTTEYSPLRGYYKTNQLFRAYDSQEEGLKDYFEFLKKNKRYQPLFGEADPYKAVDIMATTGYAGDKSYRPKLYGIVKEIQEMQA